MASVMAAEMSVELTGRDGVTTVSTDSDLVRFVICKEIHFEKYWTICVSRGQRLGR